MISFKSIKLRAPGQEDAPYYHEWINDPETNHWRGLYHPLSPEEARDSLMELARKDQTKLTLLITDAEGRPVGLIGLRSICPRSRRAELWIVLGQKNVGRGMGGDSIAALCDYAFNQMNLHRIWLEANPDNKRAIRCFEKNGFILEGRLRDGYFRHGRYQDTVIMGRLRTDGRTSPV